MNYRSVNACFLRYFIFFFARIINMAAWKNDYTDRSVDIHHFQNRIERYEKALAQKFVYSYIISKKYIISGKWKK